MEMHIICQSIALACTQLWVQSTELCEAGMVKHACNPDSPDVEVRSQPELHEKKGVKEKEGDHHFPGGLLLELKITLYIIPQSRTRLYCFI